MGCQELIASLRIAGEEKVRALQQESEQEAERIRSDAAGRIEAIRQRHERERKAEAAKQTEALLAAAAGEARRIRIRSERALADRLASLARTLLPSLRNVGYDGVFGSFVQELPTLPWRSVRVNGKDVALAKAYFPDAEIVPDNDISGGLVVSTEDDRVRVVNTFEKRMERKWEDLLLEAIPDVMEKTR
jgi:vacuolar-type H+-ATPase subunit E/Vma4